MDPITIGLAFAAAQSAVGHIKQAIAHDSLDTEQA